MTVKIKPTIAHLILIKTAVKSWKSLLNICYQNKNIDCYIYITCVSFLCWNSRKKIDKNFVISDTGITWIESYSFPVLEEGRGVGLSLYLGNFEAVIIESLSPLLHSIHEVAELSTNYEKKYTSLCRVKKKTT